jgi:hypothetical protein
MARPKGLPKTGGRKSGTPNRDSQALIERLEALGCDPIEGLARIALDPATKIDLKVRCFAELAQYVYPKRKAVDFALGESRDLKVVVEYIGGKAEEQGESSKALKGRDCL